MKINKKLIFAILGAVVVVLAVASIFWPQAQRGYWGKMESITIGRPVSDSGALIFIAEDQHLFTGNGIKVTQKDYDTGLAAISDLLNNEIELSGSGEFPLVVKALENASLSIIGSFARSFNTYLVARVDKGIKNEADLRGKRIGLPRRTIPEFYLGRFLDLHGMSIRDVTLTGLTPKQAVGAIANGAVDAVVVWEPYVSQIREQLTNRIVSWSVHSGQAQYSVLVGRNDWIRQNPELVKRVLKSLMQAEEYAVRHPAEAKAILKKRYQHDDAYVARVWSELQFSIFLDQALILALEDEARWMIKNNLTKEKQVPDFLNYIYADGLKAVKPKAVNIIR
jgi:NitT/TauT family transport system substrate-binding protein